MRLAGRRDRDRGYTVPAAIGERHYWDAVGRLWPELVASTFDEPVPAAGFGYADWPAAPFEPESYRRAVPRYFSDRRELLEILRRAVDTMFGGAAADAGKPTWCEKTPFNLCAWTSSGSSSLRRPSSRSSATRSRWSRHTSTGHGHRPRSTARSHGSNRSMTDGSSGRPPGKSQ